MLASAHPLAEHDSTFDAVFSEHFRFVWSCVAYAGVPASAVEDAVQEVFITVYRRLDRLEPGAPIRPWLYGISRRVAWRWRRSRARHCRKVAALAHCKSTVQSDPEGAHIAAAVVRRFVQQLSEPRREIFVHAELLGMTGPEIADLLGLKLNTIYWHQRMARQALAAFAAERKLDAAVILEATRHRHRASEPQQQRAWLLLLPQLGSAAPLLTAGRLGLGALWHAGEVLRAAVVAVTMATVGVVVATTTANAGARPEDEPARAALSAPALSSPALSSPALVPNNEDREHDPDDHDMREALPSPSPVPPPAPATAPTRIPAPSSRHESPPAIAPPLAGGGDEGADVSAELRLLQRARRALETGDAAGAHRELLEHHRLFPSGSLVDVRDALQVSVLCALGRDDQAARRAALFLERYPGSPLRSRVEEISKAPHGCAASR